MNFKKKYKRRKCYICKNEIKVNYKNVDFLRKYIGHNGKIKPRKATGICAKHQRKVAKEVKKARKVALLPFV